MEEEGEEEEEVEEEEDSEVARKAAALAAKKKGKGGGDDVDAAAAEKAAAFLGKRGLFGFVYGAPLSYQRLFVAKKRGSAGTRQSGAEEDEAKAAAFLAKKKGSGGGANQCEECEAPLKPGAAFCKSCGAKQSGK